VSRSGGSHFQTQPAPGFWVWQWPAGNLYGTTDQGGGHSVAFGPAGVVFQLTPDGTYSVLYSFCAQPGCADGRGSQASLIMDAAGNLYGTTLFGGISNCPIFGCGVVFKLAPDGTETVLYSFCPLSHCPDGSFPSGLVMDAAGNLYGTTQEGGISPFVGGGAGVVFKLAPNGTYTVRYSFCPQNGCADGSHPGAGLIIDGAGNLYGTTYQGGTNNNGVVFQLAPDGTYTVLYNFCQQSNCADGANPLAGLVIDAAGNLYGTTYQGGTSDHNAGTVFALAPDGTYTVLYSFCSVIFCFDGSFPTASLIMDAAGTLYGTTIRGGAGQSADAGTVFMVAPGAGTRRPAGNTYLLGAGRVFCQPDLGSASSAQ